MTPGVFNLKYLSFNWAKSQKQFLFLAQNLGVLQPSKTRYNFWWDILYIFAILNVFFHLKANLILLVLMSSNTSKSKSKIFMFLDDWCYCYLLSYTYSNLKLYSVFSIHRCSTFHAFLTLCLCIHFGPLFEMNTDRLNSKQQKIKKAILQHSTKLKNIFFSFSKEQPTAARLPADEQHVKYSPN